MFDLQETSNHVTSLICHVPVLITLLINSTSKHKQFWWTVQFLNGTA